MLLLKFSIVLLSTVGFINAQGDFHQTTFEGSHTASDCKINLGGGAKPFSARDLFDGIIQVFEFVPDIGPVIGDVYSYGSKIYDFLDGIISPKKDKIVDIWNCIRADVEALVDEKIADEAFKEATEKLEGITDSLELYQCTFYHWAHNTSDPCRQELSGAYSIGDQAMSLFDRLQDDIPLFGSITQQKALLPYYIFVATLHFSIAADIWVYGDKWEIESDVLTSVRDVSLARLNTYSAHVMDVLNRDYIGTCMNAGYAACSFLHREIMDGSVRMVPTWPVLASFGSANRSEIVIHNSHHMVSGMPEHGTWGYSPVISKDMINHLLFNESRIYEQTVCTSPDYIVFGYNDFLDWDGGFAGRQPYVFSTGNLQWTFGENTTLCRGSYMATFDPRCTGCSRYQYNVGPWHRMDKRVGGGSLVIGGANYEISQPDDPRRRVWTYPVMTGLDCGAVAGTCHHNLATPLEDGYVYEGIWYSSYTITIPENYQIYNIHPTCPNNLDIADVLMNWGNTVLLEFAPVHKSFDSLVVNGTTHVIPGVSPNMEWAPNADFKDGGGFNEYLFGGHAAYSIGGGGSYYNINTPLGEPVEKLTVGAFILDETASYSANIMHETDTLNIQLNKTDIVMTGVQGQYTLYVSGVNSIPSAIKKIAITGTRGSLLGAIILSNDVGST